MCASLTYLDMSHILSVIACGSIQSNPAFVAIKIISYFQCFHFHPSLSSVKPPVEAVATFLRFPRMAVRPLVTVQILLTRTQKKQCIVHKLKKYYFYKLNLKRSMHDTHSVTRSRVLRVRGSQKVPNIMINDPGCVKR